MAEPKDLKENQAPSADTMSQASMLHMVKERLGYVSHTSFVLSDTYKGYFTKYVSSQREVPLFQKAIDDWAQLSNNVTASKTQKYSPR